MANTTTFSFTKEGNVLNQHHLIAQVLREALPYIDFLKEKTLVIKLGGSTLEHQRSVIQDIIWLQALGAHPVLVHGGGPYINEWLMNVTTRITGMGVAMVEILDLLSRKRCDQFQATPSTVCLFQAFIRPELPPTLAVQLLVAQAGMRPWCYSKIWGGISARSSRTDKDRL